MIKYDIILDNISSGVMVIDNTLKVEYWNKWMEIYTGIHQKEAFGKKLDEIFLLSDAGITSLNRKIKSALLLKAPSFYASTSNDDIFPIEKQRITKSFYKDMQQDVKIVPYDIDKKKVVIIINDITNLMEAKHSLEEINKNLEHRIKDELIKYDEQRQILMHQSRFAAMGEMIGNIAHQWRQPLNALSLVIGNIKDAFLLERLDEAYLNKASDKAHRLIQKMSTTIDDFRDFFNIDKTVSVFSLCDIVDETIHLLSGTLKNNNIQITTEVSKEIKINGFKNEYSQVVLNIINNAKDALMENNIDNATISIKGLSAGDTSILTIEDNAGGIPDSVINRIFEPYFTTKKQGKGTGIGLYMSMIIIKEHMNGSINVKNTEAGALFTVEVRNAEVSALTES